MRCLRFRDHSVLIICCIVRAMEPLALESRYPPRVPARGIPGGPPAVAAPGPERYLAERPAIAQVV